MNEPYASLEFTPQFFDAFGGSQFSNRERRQIVKAFGLLDTNERHASLRVHQLRGTLAGLWSASANMEIRLIFERLPGGRKRLHDVTRHYGD